MRPNQNYIEELEQVLADQFTAFFPDGIGPEVEKETFQSQTFQRAGLDTMPERYGLGDRFMYTVKGRGGIITVVVSGRISSGNPFEVMHASWPGVLDLRKDMTVVYQFDGKDKITETKLKTEGKNEYSEEYGNLSFLFGCIRDTLGKQVTE